MSAPLEILLLRLWAFAAGLALWAPAVMVPVAGLPFQPLDLLVPAGWPLLAAHARRLPPGLSAVVLSALLSLAFSWLIAGGVWIVLAWTLGFALPFVLLAGLAACEPGAARALTGGFLLGAGLSLVLFVAQLVVGAEVLDFRNNYAFRLPPHYGRGFALFPEVSTFAAHGVLAFCALLVPCLSPQSGKGRLAVRLLAAAVAVALLFTQSTTLLVVLPLLAAVALAKTTRASFNTLVLTMLLALGLALLVMLFVQSFYTERLQSASAERSASMRLASLLGGLSILWSGDVFGVGIGRNELVAPRAFAVARALGLSFGALPEGVNGQLVGRIFEEGWPAVLHYLLGGALLIAALRRARAPGDAMLALMALGSLMISAAVVGYRGVYTNWLWLALPAGLLARLHAATPRAPPASRQPDGLAEELDPAELGALPGA